MSKFRLLASLTLAEKGVAAYASMRLAKSGAECFARLKDGSLAWFATLPASGKHSLSVESPVSRKDAACHSLLEEVCQYWNTDPELEKLSSVHIEWVLTHRDNAWIGCGTAVDEFAKTSAQRDMHLVDHEALCEEAERRAQLPEKPAQSRQDQPAAKPVELPENIATEIASYLRLEYGERSQDKASLKEHDLLYEGEFVLDGVPTRFWRYPTRDGFAWATVERYESSYCLGMTDTPPPSSNETLNSPKNLGKL
ncbi:MAG: hypothetical protein AB1717_00555 [Pseudomonadota bacterium]